MAAVRLAGVFGALVAVGAGFVLWVSAMPGESHAGEPGPLSDRGIDLRNRARGHRRSLRYRGIDARRR